MQGRWLEDGLLLRQTQSVGADAGAALEMQRQLWRCRGQLGRQDSREASCRWVALSPVEPCTNHMMMVGYTQLEAHWALTAYSSQAGALPVLVYFVLVSNTKACSVGCGGGVLLWDRGWFMHYGVGSQSPGHTSPRSHMGDRITIGCGGWGFPGPAPVRRRFAATGFPLRLLGSRFPLYSLNGTCLLCARVRRPTAIPNESWPTIAVRVDRVPRDPPPVTTGG